MSDRKQTRFVANVERLEDRLTPSALPLDAFTAPLGGPTVQGPAEVAGVRFRSFANTGGREIFLGIPDLGQGGNRVETDYTWQQPGVFFAALYYDPETLLLTTIVVNLETVNLGLLFFDRFTEPLELDSVLIRLADRDTDSQVDFLGVDADGTALGDFVGNDGAQEFGFANGDLNDGFLIYGFIVLDGSFSQSAELSKVEILVGRGLAPFNGSGVRGRVVGDAGTAVALLAGPRFGEHSAFPGTVVSTDSAEQAALGQQPERPGSQDSAVVAEALVAPSGQVEPVSDSFDEAVLWELAGLTV